MTVEILRILESFETLRREGKSAVLASVVHVEGSTYRRPGARALIPRSGEIVGLIGGGCLEADLLRQAEGVRDSQRAAVVHFDNSAPDDIVWGLGLGCAGKVDVLLEPVSGSSPGPLDAVATCMSRRRPSVMATVIGTRQPAVLGARRVHDGAETQTLGEWPAECDVAAVSSRVLLTGQHEVIEVEGRRILVEKLQVPVQLLVVGAGPDAVPLVELASGLGWVTDVVDHRQGFARCARFPRARSVRHLPVSDTCSSVSLDGLSAAVLMTHNYLNDLEILAGLLTSDAAYLGVLGPKARLEMLLRDLHKEGAEPNPDQLARLRGPVGLDLGAESPEEIALAIVAEIKAHFSGRAPIPLAEKKGGIH